MLSLRLLRAWSLRLKQVASPKATKAQAAATPIQVPAIAPGEKLAGLGGPNTGALGSGLLEMVVVVAELLDVPDPAELVDVVVQVLLGPIPTRL